MAVDYDEGRRLLAARNEAQEKFGDTPKDTDMLIVARAEMAFDNWLHANAEALLNPDPWRPIEEADKGCGKYRGPSYATWHPKRNGWRRGCWNPRYHASKAEGYWQTDGGSITQDRDDPPTHFRELKGPGQ